MGAVWVLEDCNNRKQKKDEVKKAHRFMLILN